MILKLWNCWVCFKLPWALKNKLKLASSSLLCSVVTTILEGPFLPSHMTWQALYHLRRRWERNSQRLTSTSVGFKSTSSGKLPSFHDSRISHMTAPVGSRPLSCGQEQCWCWFPRIHRDRFHPPEKKMKKTIPQWDRNITHLFDKCDKRQNISPVECTTKKKPEAIQALQEIGSIWCVV